MRLSFTGFLKESAPKQLKGYGPGVKGAGNHVTYTCLQNKDDQITIDVPDNEWHHTIKGITKKIGKANNGSLEKFLGEAFKPLKTGAAEILPGQNNMFAMKDDVDPTLSGQAHDDNREEYDPSHKKHPKHAELTKQGYAYSGSYNNVRSGKRIHTYHHDKLEPKEIQKEDFMSTQIPISHGRVNSEDVADGYSFPQDQVSDVSNHERKRPDSLNFTGAGGGDTGFGGRTECLDIITESKKPKCPYCGSRDYSLMPTDFETAKCNQCGKNWDHGIVPGVNDPKQEMADYAQGLGATDSQYSGSVEKNKMVEKKKTMGTPAYNDYIGGMGGVGASGNLPQEG